MVPLVVSHMGIYVNGALKLVCPTKLGGDDKNMDEPHN